MRTVRLAVYVAALMGLATIASAASFHEVKPGEFDPGKTRLSQATWQKNVGCPTNATTFNGSTSTPFTAGGCPTGDSSDKYVNGLLLVKTGPTANFAAPFAELKDVKNISLSELGYDLRKPGADQNDIRGSHCGAGAPRFNVVTSDNVTHFVGCNSPAPAVAATGDGWMRLRWNAAALAAAFPPILGTDKVKSIAIVFDEGQDTGPDNFGLAILDNIDVNGTLVGKGPED